MAGSFVSDVPIGQLKDYKVVGTKLDELRITPGTWKVRAAIAYGYDVEPVQQAVKESLAAGQEHPINAVVRWQRVEYSVPVVIGIL